MLTTAIPANATALPALIGTSAKSVRSDTFQLDAWAEAIGRTVADVAALVFVLPMPAHLLPVIEDAIRQEVAAVPDLSGNEAQRIEAAASIAFNRRRRDLATAALDTGKGMLPMRFPTRMSGKQNEASSRGKPCNIPSRQIRP